MFAEFRDSGPSWGRKRERILELEGRRLSGKLRRVKRGPLPRTTAYVVSGFLAQSLIPSSTAEELKAFSRKVSVPSSSERQAQTSAYKAFVADGHWGRRVAVCAWTHGPIPVLKIGEAKGVPVYATPISRLFANRQPGVLPARTTSAEGLLSILDLGFCFEEYFADIADIMHAGFFRGDRSQALAVAKKVNEILSGSINEKLKLLVNSQSRLNAAAQQKRAEIIAEHEVDIRNYQAAAALVRVMVGLLKWVAGEEVNISGSFVDAEAAFDRAGDHPEMVELQRALETLKSSATTKSLSALPPLSVGDGWKTELLLCSEFLSNIVGALKEYSRDKLFVFVSHHMNTFGGEWFFDRLRNHVKDSHVVVWTGDGQPNDLVLRILAQLWLSDVQLVFLPNSLVCRDGTTKQLKTAGDWLVEEVFYGTVVSKKFKFVVADGPNPESHARTALLAQLREYDWTSLSPLLQSEESAQIGQQIWRRVNEHLHAHRFDTYAVDREGMSAHNEDWFSGLVEAAVEQRVVDRLSGLKLGMPADRWAVARALYKASRTAASMPTFEPVTLQAVLTELAGYRRHDGHPITYPWVEKEVRLLQVTTVSLNGTVFPIAKNGPRQKKNKTVTFSLHEFIEQACGFYRPGFGSCQIEAMLEQLMRFRVPGSTAA